MTSLIGGIVIVFLTFIGAVSFYREEELQRKSVAKERKAKRL
jgi:hypothetical protein